MVEEVDASGHSRVRVLEQFFYGIVGHVRDRNGRSVDGWHQSAQLANYWRRHFQLPEEQDPYHDHHLEDFPETTDGTSASEHRPRPSAPIRQLAWLLHSVLSQDPEANDSILLAFLPGHLAIILSRRARGPTTDPSPRDDLSD